MMARTAEGRTLSQNNESLLYPTLLSAPSSTYTADNEFLNKLPNENMRIYKNPTKLENDGPLATSLQPVQEEQGPP